MPLNADDERTRAALQPLEAIVFDVDGVLTDGLVEVSDDGSITKRFSMRDGAGLAALARLGVRLFAISGHASAATEKRLSGLGFTEVATGVGQKGPRLEALIATHGLDRKRLGAMGDDWIDLALFQRVATSFAPADAATEILEAADFVTSAKGGQGAARELAEAILKAKGLYAELIREHQR